MGALVTDVPQSTIYIAATGSSTAALALGGASSTANRLRIVGDSGGGVAFFRIGSSSVGAATTPTASVVGSTPVVSGQTLLVPLADGDTHIRVISASLNISVSRCFVAEVD
jgi:hypothetical protein